MKTPEPPFYTSKPAMFDDELLRSSLGEHDDASGFNRPWNPMSLVMLTFFAGIAAGGALLALNYERLGIQGRRYLIFGVVILLDLLLVLLSLIAIQQSWLDPQKNSEMRTLRLILNVTSVMLALVIAKTQHQRFRLFQHSSLPAGSLWVPGIIAVVWGWAFRIVAFTVIAPYALRV